LSKKKTAFETEAQNVRKKFAEVHQNENEAHWRNILWSVETKINFFCSDGVQHVWREVGQDYHEDCVVPTVEHGRGSVLIWGCMSASGTGEMTFIDGIMNT